MYKLIAYFKMLFRARAWNIVQRPNDCVVYYVLSIGLRVELQYILRILLCLLFGLVALFLYEHSFIRRIERERYVMACGPIPGKKVYVIFGAVTWC